MKLALWIIAGLVALDVVIVLLLAVGAAVVRRRSEAAHARVRRPILEISESGGGQVISLPLRDEDAGAAAIEQEARSVPAASSSRARRLAMVGVATLMLGAGTAIASPRAREVMATALSVVVDTFSPAADGTETSSEPNGESTDDETPSAADATASPAVSTGSGGPRGSGGRPSGPSLGSRPPGAAPGPASAPSPPNAVTATAMSSSEVQVVWSDVATETIYRIERSTDAAGWSVVASVDQDVTRFTNSGLDPGATYFYRLVASNAGGESSPSGVASATTAIDPASPTTLSASADGSNRVILSWTDVAAVTGNRVERSDGAGGWLTIATTGQDVTSYVDVDLASETTYLYRVFATNGGGDSPASDVVSVTTGTADLGGADPGATVEGPPG